MNFVHPNILYFLFLLIIPIIIHLFNFRRYKKIYFSSLQFIQKVEKETNSTRTLRHYLILASRILAFTTLIFAFAQPYFPSAISSNTKENTIAIYLDNSFSMTAKGSNGDLFNQAKNSIHEMLETLPKDQQYMLLTNDLNSSEFREITASELQDRLDELRTSPIFRTLPTILENLKNHKETAENNGTYNVLFFSDFQKSTLVSGQMQADTTANYTLFQIQPEISRNVYVDSVWFEQPFQRINTNSTLNVRIFNAGKQKLTNVELNLNVGEIKRQSLVDLEAESSVVIPLNFTHKTAGIKGGFVEVIDENLFFDNRYYFSFSVKETTKIVVVNDEKSSPLPKYVFDTDDFYAVSEIAVRQLKSNSLNEAEIIILNGLQDISSGLQSQLLQLVQNGVHFLLIPPSDFDVSSYNRLLGAFELPLLRERVNQEIRIGKIFTEMPFFQGMFEDKVDKIRMPPLKRYLSSTIYSNANFSSLIQYENGMPLLARNERNKNVYILYSPIDATFDDFGKSALFSSVLLRISELSYGNAPLSLTIGSGDAYILPHLKNSQQALFLQQNELKFIPEINSSGNSPAISVRYAADNQFIQDGIYEILSDENQVGKLALNFNRMESTMEYASPEELSDFFKTLNVIDVNTTQLSKNMPLQQFINAQSNEYWKILLLLAFVFFLMEMMIIIFWKT